MEPVPFPLNDEEVKTIRAWFEYYRVDSQHYGDGVSLFPQEEIVLQKLDGRNDGAAMLTYYDMETVKSWMDKAVYRRYGNQQYMLGTEEGLVRRITVTFLGLEVEMHEETEELKRRAAEKQPQTADQDGGETDDAPDRDERMHKAAETVRDLHEERDARKNRSFDEKLDSTLKLKKELEDAQRKIDEVKRKSKKKG